jgi:hypothetical protein
MNPRGPSFEKPQGAEAVRAARTLVQKVMDHTGAQKEVAAYDQEQRCRCLVYWWSERAPVQIIAL